MKNLLLISFVLLFSISVYSQESGLFKDMRNGKVYKTTKIGTQVWMAENLNYETASSFCYDNNPENCVKYGRLYRWEDAVASCPPNWRVPNDNDWETLISFYGMKHSAGALLKAVGTDMWQSPNTGATNKSGFSALPGGEKSLSGDYAGLGTTASFWSLFNDGTNAWGRHLSYDSENFNSFNTTENKAYSVRCIKGQ